MGTPLRSSLHHLVWTNDLEALRTLLDSGVDVNETDNESGWTPLHKALYLGHVRCAVVLLEYGAHVDVKDPRGLTPLDLVTRELLAGGRAKRSKRCKEQGVEGGAGADVGNDWQANSRTEVYTWGNGANYQLGIGTADLVSSPKRVTPLSSVKVQKMAASKFHTVALSQDNEVYTWGWGRGGRLGHEDMSVGNKGTAQIYPRLVTGLRGKAVTGISAAKHHTLAVTSRGEVFSWGSNKDGKLGYQSVDTQPVPRRVIALKGMVVKAVSAANRHSAALVSGGVVYTWGANRYGQLGYGTSDSVSNTTPRCVESVQSKHVCGISTSKRHTLVVTTEGEVFSWGYTFVIPKKLGFRLHRSRFQTAAGQEISFHHGYEDVYRPFVVKIAAGVGQSTCITRNGDVLVWNSAANDLEAVSVGGSLCGKTGVSIGAGKSLMVVVGALGEIHTWEAPKVDGLESRNTIVSPEATRIDGTIRAADVWVGEKHVVALQHWQPSYDEVEHLKLQESPHSDSSSDTTTSTDQMLETSAVGRSIKQPAYCNFAGETTSHSVPRLQDECERVVAEHVLDPRNALQLFTYADSVGASCLRRHSLNVVVLNLDLVLAETKKQLLETSLPLLLEIEQGFQSKILGIELNTCTPPWWLETQGHQTGTSLMGKRPTLSCRLVDDGDLLTPEPSSRQTDKATCLPTSFDSYGTSEPGFMDDRMAPVVKMRDKLERNIRKKLQQIASLEVKESQGQFLDDQQQLKLSRKEALENGLRHLNAGVDVRAVQSLISIGTPFEGTSDMAKTRDEQTPAVSLGSDFGTSKDSTKHGFSVFKKRKKKKKAGTLNCEKNISCQSEKSSPVVDTEEPVCTMGFSVSSDSLAQTSQAQPARTKGRKGGLSAFLSGQLERSSVPLDVTKSRGGPAWNQSSIATEQLALKDIMHQEQPATKACIKVAAKELAVSTSRWSLQDFMPRPVKPKKNGPAWGGVGAAPSNSEIPSIQGIQDEQVNARQRKWNHSKLGARGCTAKSRWYIPEEPEVQDIRSIQFEEHNLGEMSRESQKYFRAPDTHNFHGENEKS